MPPTRRRALRLGAVAFAGSLAGCAGGALDASGSETAGSETTADAPDPETADPEATDSAAAESVAFPAGPKSRPERPADLTREAVREYAKSFERRWVYNRLHREDSTAVHRECGVDSVTADGEGFRAVVWCSAWANAGRDGTTLHADYFTQYATYFVGPNATVRYEGKTETRE